MSATPGSPPATLEQAYAILAQLAEASALPGTEGLRAGAASVEAGAGMAAPARGEADERRLRLAEARYEVLIEQIPAVTFLASLAGDQNEIYVSPQIESLLGFTQEEWVSDPILWYRQIHPEDREQLSHEFATACVTGQPFRGVVRVFTRGGELRWVHAEARFVRDEHGELLFLQGVGFDITEQFRAQEAREQLLREQAARAEADRERQYLQELLTTLPAAISVLRGSDHAIEFLNPAAAELAGGAAAMIGQPWAKAFPEFGEQTDRAMDTVLATREPYLVREYRTYSPRWGGERFFNFICEPLRNPQGGVPLLLTHAMDVTEQVLARRRVEDLAEQLEVERARLDAVLQQLPAGVIIVDAASGRVLLRNAQVEQIWRRPLPATPEIGVYSEYQGYHPDGRPYLAEEWPLTRSITTGEVIAGEEIDILRGDGTSGTIAVSAAPIRDANGRVSAGVMVFHDITARKRAEEEIRRLNVDLHDRAAELTTANKELEAFSYSVSHDLRAPLRSIDGFSQALLEDYAEHLDAEGADYLHRVRAASQRMAELIDDMLHLSRVTRAEMHRAPVDLSTLVAAVAAELQQRQPERQVELVIGEGLVATGDARLLRAVLENLLGNAWKFTSKHDLARVEFGCTEIDDQPTYFVRDNGAGFDMRYADQLFSPFERLHSVDEFEGTGIGLATVQRIIHRHGGRIWAQGMVDQGATFYFTL